MEQVAWAFSKADVMLPFRDLLKSTIPFVWRQELQVAFTIAKSKIVELVKEGVKSFELNCVMVVNPDWNKVGIGFALMQKYCTCPLVNLKCCRESWRLCLVESRFCTGAESQYMPIEGEALGVAWALNNAHHYVMGCPSLYVGVDHKPLLGIYLPKKALADIDNLRLRNLAEKATRYRFNTFHVKGTENSTPDALSWYPTELAGMVDGVQEGFLALHPKAVVSTQHWGGSLVAPPALGRLCDCVQGLREGYIIHGVDDTRRLEYGCTHTRGGAMV